MKRLFAFIAALVLTSSGVYAQHITEQQARERALQYIKSGKASAAAKRMAAPSRNGDIKLQSAPVEASSIYAFNLENGGFIIASADSRALPVLGYSTNGSIDWELMPDNIREWLKGYDEAIATLGNRTDFIDGNALSSTLKTDEAQDRVPVEPLIKTHWSQDAPYWDQTPIYKGPRSDWQGKQTLTGCAATTFAQIMNYYQWPKTMPDGLPDYNATTFFEDVPEDYNYNIDALPPVKFDWDNMLNDYQIRNPETQQTEQAGTEQQRRAVAVLMRYCGQALKIQYSPEGSGAFRFMYQEVLNNIFDYPAALWLQRSEYRIDEWDDIIYGELAAGRPIQYSGTSSIGAHSFICDGYDGNGLFHINWGWSGSCDGYYALSVLNPYISTSTELGSSSIGFCMDQAVVIYTDPAMEIRPRPETSQTEFPLLYQYSGIIVKENNTVVYYYQYDGEDARKAVADYALGIPEEGGAWLPRFMGDPNDSIIFPENKMTLKIDSTVFQPGDSVTLYPLLRFRNKEAQWQVIPPLESHLTTGRTDQGNFFITIHGGIKMLDFVNGYISKGTGRLTQRNDLTVVLKNNTDWDYQKLLRITPMYFGHIDPSDISQETPFIWGDEMKCTAYIRAHQEGEITFSFVPMQGGHIEFWVQKPSDYLLDTFSLDLKDDTLVDYNEYIENKSYFARQDSQWVYHVELRDKAGVNIPYWIPSDSVHLIISTFVNDYQTTDTTITDEIRDYLTELPYKGGKGNHKMTINIPVDLNQNGCYYIKSYLEGWTGQSSHIVSGLHEYQFQYSNPTGVKPADAVTTVPQYFDLYGRPVQGIPDRKGLYIQGQKKVYK